MISTSEIYITNILMEDAMEDRKEFWDGMEDLYYEIRMECPDKRKKTSSITFHPMPWQPCFVALEKKTYQRKIRL